MYASAYEDRNPAALRSTEADAKPGSESQDFGSDRSLERKRKKRAIPLKYLLYLGTHQSLVYITASNAIEIPTISNAKK